MNTTSKGRADTGPTLNGSLAPLADFDAYLPDEYDHALYRIDQHDRARLAVTLGRVNIASVPL